MVPAGPHGIDPWDPARVTSERGDCTHAVADRRAQSGDVARGCLVGRVDPVLGGRAAAAAALVGVVRFWLAGVGGSWSRSSSSTATAREKHGGRAGGRPAGAGGASLVHLYRPPRPHYIPLPLFSTGSG